MMQHEVSLSLTTPVPRDHDTAFPGESWFFYWKTSASLWRSKIENFAGNGKIIIPINWSFHTETGESYDFAEQRPETDLKKLSDICISLGREAVFLVPTGPVPFLANGGVPHLMARSPLVGSDGVQVAVVDPDQSINKLYSFFDTRIFKAYGQFLRDLGNYISSAGIPCDVWGLECGYVDDEGFQTYFKDYSSTYEQGFGKFLETKKENESEEVSSIQKEEELHQEFYETIHSLYQGQVETCLAGNFEGHIRTSFLGGSPKDLFRRANHVESISGYCNDTLESISLDVLPSSVLIPSRLKEGVLGKLLDDSVNKGISELSFRTSYYEDDNVGFFQPLRFFEVFDIQDDAPADVPNWADLSLWDFLQQDYRWCYADLGEKDFIFDESIEAPKITFFFHGHDMSKKLFNNLLKAFLNGGKVILNRSGLSTDLLRRLETFLLENSLNVEKVNLHTTIHNVTLGQGRMLIFDGSKLSELSEDKCFDFWKKVFSTFHYNHMKISVPEGIQFLWRYRPSSHNELSFEEVRRLGIYNPSSYKRKFKLQVPKTFSLLKIIDERNVTFKTQRHECELELHPDGSVTFEFGEFS